jgi:ubiquinone/menaquinone biosynthesis C-methylase UbiE
MRVLRPGGTLVILEASNIPVKWLQRVYLRYMSICIPLVGWLATLGDASAYKYLLRGIREFPTAEQAGFAFMGWLHLVTSVLDVRVCTPDTKQRLRRPCDA